MTPLRTGWRKLRKLSQLPGQQRRLVARAAAWLLAVDVGLRVLGFARVRRLLAGRPATPSDAGAGAGRRGEAEAVAWAVAVAAHHHLYSMRCLTRSLVLHRFLARRGIPSELQIGVRKEGRELLAHAWVECAGRPLGEGADVEERYAALGLPSP